MFPNVNVALLLRAAVENIATGVRCLRGINPLFYVYVVLLFVGITLTNEVHQFRKELNSFRGSVVFDIDKIREKYLTELQYMYTAGCKTGIEYPPEYREDQTGFNLHSPVIYCDEEKEKLNDYFYDQIKNIGR